MPLNLLFIVVCLGLILKHIKSCKFSQKIGKLLLQGAVVYLILIAFLPTGHNMLVWLESQYQQNDPFEAKGIIVLGGAFNIEMTSKTGSFNINENAERIAYIPILMKWYPDASVIYTGGTGKIDQTKYPSEAGIAEAYFKEIGFEKMDRMIFETKSKNTYENAINSKEIAQPKDGETWILVTSAWHMPRAMAVFKQAGWDVTPYPVGHLSDGQYQILPDRLDLLENIYKFEIAFKEILGMLAYRITGRAAG